MPDDNMPNQGVGGGLSDLVSTIKGAVQNLSQLNTTLQNAFPRINGTFTLSAGTTTIVTQPSIGASGIPLITATNATAALTVRTAGLFVSAMTAGVGFSLSTQSGTAQGTETFKYVVVNPS